MKSCIAESIKLRNHPVAVLRLDDHPENTGSFQKAKRPCVISWLHEAARGKNILLDEKISRCPDGKAGLAINRRPQDYFEDFLLTGRPGVREGEFYEKDSDPVAEFAVGMPEIGPKKYVIFKPLKELTANETPEIVVFLVNADQLSAMMWLANYDQASQDNVLIDFGSGCQQVIRFALEQAGKEHPKCTIGMTDPSARKCIKRDLLSFSFPYKRFMELESQANASLLTKETWLRIAFRPD